MSEGRLADRAYSSIVELINADNLAPGDRLPAEAKLAREAEMDGGENDRQRFAVKVIERILTQFDDLAAEDLDYLLTKLNQLAA